MINRTLFPATVLLCLAPLLAQAQAVPAQPEPPAPRTDPGIEIKPQTGVIQPGKTDPGFTRPPAPGDSRTVVPPPGSPGGNPAVIPK